LLKLQRLRERGLRLIGSHAAQPYPAEAIARVEQAEAASSASQPSKSRAGLRAIRGNGQEQLLPTLKMAAGVSRSYLKQDNVR